MSTRFLATAILSVLFVAGTAGPAVAQNQAAVDSAKQAAQEWLALLDADRHEATWTEASSYFQSNVGKQQWAQKVRGTHQPLDSLRSRSLVAARYTTSVPKAPTGEYVVAQYRATYGSRSMVETLYLKKEQDGWGVADYLIRPNQQ